MCTTLKHFLTFYPHVYNLGLCHTTTRERTIWFIKIINKNQNYDYYYFVRLAYVTTGTLIWYFYCLLPNNNILCSIQQKKKFECV